MTDDPYILEHGGTPEPIGEADLPDLDRPRVARAGAAGVVAVTAASSFEPGEEADPPAAAGGPAREPAEMPPGWHASTGPPEIGGAVDVRLGAGNIVSVRLHRGRLALGGARGRARQAVAAALAGARERFLAEDPTWQACRQLRSRRAAGADRLAAAEQAQAQAGAEHRRCALDGRSDGQAWKACDRARAEAQAARAAAAAIGEALAAAEASARAALVAALAAASAGLADEARARRGELEAAILGALRPLLEAFHEQEQVAALLQVPAARPTLPDN
jgi:hypothetical protein